MENDIEKKADELLEALGKELAKSRVRYADAVLEGKGVFSFAEEAVLQSAHRRILRRMLILVAVIVMLMGMAVVSVDGVREHVFNFFLSDAPGSTEITPIDHGESEAFPNFELGYLPDGYELISSDGDEIMGIWQTYGNEEDLYLDFSLCRSEYYSPSVDNDTMKHEQTRVNVYEAQLFSDDNDCYLVWQVGDYVLSLYGTVDKEAMIEIAENIRIGD